MTTPDNYALIRQAILERWQVQATYEGRPRELCPHVLGTKGGRLQVLAFQFAGGSRKGLPPRDRCGGPGPRLG